MRKAGVVALIVLSLLLVIPIGIAMAIGTCPDCTTPGAPSALAICAALVFAIVLAAAGFSVPLGYPASRSPARAFARDLYRPPRES